METFLNYYQKTIQQQIAAADVFLRTEPQPFPLKKAAKILHISVEEATRILQKNGNKAIDKDDFLHLMQQGSTPFCRMFRRELESGLPKAYTAEQISFIYDLDISVVLCAMERIGFSKVQEPLLPLLFDAIPLSDTQYRL